jgi:hypothetical protein
MQHNHKRSPCRFLSAHALVVCVFLCVAGRGEAGPIFPPQPLLPPSAVNIIDISAGPVAGCCTNQVAYAYFTKYSDTLVVPGVPSATVSIGASAVADYGSSHASLSMSLNDPLSEAGSNGFMTSQWRDIWTITSGGLTGLGYLELQYAVDGSMSSAGSGKNTPYLLSDVWGPTVSTQSQFVYLTGGPQVVTMPELFSFAFGQQFDVAEQLTLQFSLGLVANGSGMISQDYSDTAALSGIRIFDSAMNPVAAFDVSANSGTVYGPDGVAPEPGTMGLFGVALVFLGAWRVRLKK